MHMRTQLCTHTYTHVHTHFHIHTHFHTHIYTRTCARTHALAGTKVVPVPLYDAMDGKDTEDYKQRVEPSVQGGRKMAKLIKECIDRAEG